MNAVAEPPIRWDPPPGTPATSPWEDAATAACLLAVDPHGLGGVRLRAAPGPVRDRWLALLARLLPEGDPPPRRVPAGVPDDRLLGGLDLAATLRAGRPVAERGLLAEADGGVLVLAMAERVPAGTAARVAAALDRGEVAAERDGLALRAPARFGVVALDEGAEPEERPPAALTDRLALHVALDAVHPREAAAAPPVHDAAAVAAARGRLSGVAAEDGIVEALCGAAMALGVDSLRAPVLALRAARAAAALAGRDAVAPADAALAARLVLAPRATRLPAVEEGGPAEEPPPEPPPPGGEAASDPEDAPAPPGPEVLRDVVLAAAAAAIPPGLLAQLRLGAGAAPRGGQGGRAGAARASARRGRPMGARAGALRSGARLSLIETLRAAAPWQRLRRAARPDGPRVLVRRDDVRVRRFRERTETVAIFAVDASGSAALHRLAEAKGAVELLLADCYVRRDKVALIAFRGAGPELLLPPTNSLVRAKRGLAALPGGGGTPLAAAIEAGAALADQVRRRGQTPLLVLLTDGRGNLARDGAAGRGPGEADALAAARAARAQGLAALVVDTSPRPQGQARRLAEALGARFLPLPQAQGAETLSRAVRAVAADG